MKLHAPKEATSFYESFSDLIFTTMAIFVLLMMVFLAMVNPKQVEALKESLAQAENKIEQQAQQIAREQAEKSQLQDQARKQSEDLAKALEAGKSRGVELIVAVDLSASMQNPINHLIETVLIIAETLPEVAPNFKIGIVGYRLRPNDPNYLHVFRLQQIRAREADGGRSLRALADFAERLRAESGTAVVREAIDEALNMFTAPRNFDGFQTMVLIGDVGPWEYPGGGIDTIEPAERTIANEIKRKVKAWVSGSTRRNMVSVFTWDIPNAERWQRDIRPESEAFFRSLVAEAGQAENFTANIGKLLAFLLRPIVKAR